MPRLCQVALSVDDLAETGAWYAEAFGMRPAGGQRIAGPAIAAVQGLPEVEAEVAWLVDCQDFFQLELFCFQRPKPCRTAGWRPSEVGYTTLGIHVADFDDALERLAAQGCAPLGPVLGDPGARRACVHDPDGILVEVAEDDPRGPELRTRVRPGVPCAVRWIRVSVPSLERAYRFWASTLSLTATDTAPLHGPEHEAGWGLDGAERSVVTLWAHDIALELVQYTLPPPLGWRPGYRISDFGVVNVALGGPELDDYRAMCERTHRAGYAANPELIRDGVAATYLTDDQGFSVELLYRSAATAHVAGFAPQRRTPSHDRSKGAQ